jgi:hypothetical protein
MAVGYGDERWQHVYLLTVPTPLEIHSNLRGFYCSDPCRSRVLRLATSGICQNLQQTMNHPTEIILEESATMQE